MKRGMMMPGGGKVETPSPVSSELVNQRLVMMQARSSYVTLAIVSLISIFALSGSFMFAHDSLGGGSSPDPALEEQPHVAYLSYPSKLGYPLQVSQAHEHETSQQLSSNSESLGEKRSTNETDRFDAAILDVSTSGSLEDNQRMMISAELLPNSSSSSSSSSRRRPPGCDPITAKLKVFMYDLPSEFHYGMIAPDAFPAGKPIWPKNSSDIPSYPGGLYQQHSPEFWLTNDLVTSNMPDRQTPCTAFRVDSWQTADVIFVPFFASLSYNRYSSKPEFKRKNAQLQQEVERFLKNQPAWQASGGYDHVIVIHHPNSMDRMRHVLHHAMFVVADFGRYSSHVANINKDIVAPYKHVIPSFHDDHSSFDDRTTLLFFQGAIVRKEGGIIRQKLYEVLKQEPGIHFEAGNTQRDGFRSATQGMRASKFCLHLAGDTPSSNRLFDAIASHCVPVIISDDLELPFEEELDYTRFCLFVKAKDALQKGFVVQLLQSVDRTEWTQMWNTLQQVHLHFTYQHPSQPNDAVNMVWKSISRKVPSIKFFLHKQNRFVRLKKTPTSFLAQQS
ncbi:hypothetical protein CY35_09G020900 [Sphagnum magellanicum]|nr:hypothetical protein CY35_09G020900 [Sphagnum magellanicum]